MSAPVPKKYNPAFEALLRGFADHVKDGGIMLEAEMKKSPPQTALADDGGHRVVTSTGTITLKVTVAIPGNQRVQQAEQEFMLAFFAAQGGAA